MHPYFALPRPQLFAHRGASVEAPENTLPAFARAVELGIRYLELDAHGTSDGEVVICHDEALERTTDGEGPIREHSWAQLQRLDAGYRFSSDGVSFPFRGRGVRMPSLRAVLAAFPGAHFNLELKQNDPSLVHEVLSIVRRAGATDRMLLAAGDDAGMEIIRKAQPDTAIGSSIGDVLAFFQALHEERVGSFRPAGHALQIPPSFAGQALISPESLQAARSLGLFVHVWTINDPGEMRRLLALGVDGVMSDDPARLLGVARELEAAR